MREADGLGIERDRLSLMRATKEWSTDSLGWLASEAPVEAWLALLGWAAVAEGALLVRIASAEPVT